MVGSLVQWRMNSDNIGPLQKGWQIHIVQGVCQLGAVNRVIGDDGGAQGPEDSGHGRSDLAGSDDPHRQVVDLMGLKPGPGIVVLGLASAGLPQMPNQTHDLGQNQFGDRPGRVGRYVGDDQPVLPSGLQVDDVIAGDPQGQLLEAILLEPLVELGLGQGRVLLDDDAVVSLDHVHGLHPQIVVGGVHLNVIGLRPGLNGLLLVGAY